MNKIASPRDLQHELGALLAYAQTETPSRARIASALNELADRVAGTFLLAAGAPRGKAQVAIIEYLKAAEGQSVELADMGRSKKFLGIHFKDIMAAANALKKAGLITYDGTSVKLVG